MARYQHLRRMRLLRLWAISRWVGKMIQWENPALCWLRNAQMTTVPNLLSTMIMRRLLHFEPSTPNAS